MYVFLCFALFVQAIACNPLDVTNQNSVDMPDTSNSMSSLVYSKPIDTHSHPVDSKPVDSKPVNSNLVDSKLTDLNMDQKSVTGVTDMVEKNVTNTTSTTGATDMYDKLTTAAAGTTSSLKKAGESFKDQLSTETLYNLPVNKQYIEYTNDHEAHHKILDNLPMGETYHKEMKKTKDIFYP